MLKSKYKYKFKRIKKYGEAIQYKYTEKKVVDFPSLAGKIDNFTGMIMISWGGLKLI
jgi:hypothetical protein